MPCHIISSNHGHHPPTRSRRLPGVAILSKNRTPSSARLKGVRGADVKSLGES